MKKTYRNIIKIRAILLILVLISSSLMLSITTKPVMSTRRNPDSVYPRFAKQWTFQINNIKEEKLEIVKTWRTPLCVSRKIGEKTYEIYQIESKRGKGELISTITIDNFESVYLIGYKYLLVRDTSQISNDILGLKLIDIYLSPPKIVWEYHDKVNMDTFFIRLGNSIIYANFADGLVEIGINKGTVQKKKIDISDMVSCYWGGTLYLSPSSDAIGYIGYNYKEIEWIFNKQDTKYQLLNNYSFLSVDVQNNRSIIEYEPEEEIVTETPIKKGILISINEKDIWEAYHKVHIGDDCWLYLPVRNQDTITISKINQGTGDVKWQKKFERNDYRILFLDDDSSCITLIDLMKNGENAIAKIDQNGEMHVMQKNIGITGNCEKVSYNGNLNLFIKNNSIEAWGLATKKLGFLLDKSYYIQDDEYWNAIEMDSSPTILQDRTYLPARYVTEPLGGQVFWDGEQRKVICKLVAPDNAETEDYKENVVELWIGKPTAKVNGVEVQIDPNNPDVVPTIINDITMVPMRFLAESLGCEVEWIPETKKIILTYTP